MSEKTAKLGSNCNRAGGEGRRQTSCSSGYGYQPVGALRERERESAAQ